jgi:hypothetical protein
MNAPSAGAIGGASRTQGFSTTAPDAAAAAVYNPAASSPSTRTILIIAVLLPLAV